MTKPGPGRSTSATRKKQSAHKAKFLELYRENGNIALSCESVPCHRATIYLWREDPEFAAAMDVAADTYSDKLEAEADRRAVDGVEKAVFFQGNRCDDGNVREYSDTLLMFRLNGLRPDKYKRVERHENEIGPNLADLITKAFLAGGAK